MEGTKQLEAREKMHWDCRNQKEERMNMETRENVRTETSNPGERSWESAGTVHGMNILGGSLGMHK